MTRIFFQLFLYFKYQQMTTQNPNDICCMQYSYTIQHERYQDVYILIMANISDQIITHTRHTRQLVIARSSYLPPAIPGADVYGSWVRAAIMWLLCSYVISLHSIARLMPHKALHLLAIVGHSRVIPLPGTLPVTLCTYIAYKICHLF